MTSEPKTPATRAKKLSVVSGGRPEWPDPDLPLDEKGIDDYHQFLNSIHAGRGVVAVDIASAQQAAWAQQLCRVWSQICEAAMKEGDLATMKEATSKIESSTRNFRASVATMGLNMKMAGKTKVRAMRGQAGDTSSAGKSKWGFLD